MLQVASFALPDQKEEANVFLATHKPLGNISFNKDMIVVFWDDGIVTKEAQIAEMRELLVSNSLSTKHVQLMP
jgi:hypothetical protein